MMANVLDLLAKEVHNPRVINRKPPLPNLTEEQDTSIFKPLTYYKI